MSVFRQGQKQVIVPTGQKARWLQARELVRDKGGLPSHVLLDDVFINGLEPFESKGYHDGWAKEIIVYPEKNGKFKDGKDVVDFYTNWILPIEYIPKEAIEKERVALFVEPKRVFEINAENVVILPEKITVLNGFIQTNGRVGIVDPVTRIPLEMPKNVEIELQNNRFRLMLRSDYSGIKPLGRDWYSGINFQYVVRADTSYDIRNVGYVENKG